MKIRTLLIVVSATLVAFTLGIGGVVVSATRRADAAAEESANAARLVRGFYQAESLAQEYAAHPDARPKEQWYIVQRGLAERLSAPASPAWRTNVLALRGGVADLKAVFDKLVAVAESRAPDAALETQTVGDLLVRSETMVRMADQLAVAADAERSRLRTEADRTTLGLLALLVAFMVAVLFFACRKILRSIARLLKGTEIIGGGDLAHRIDTVGIGEMDRLAAGMNGMAAKLQGSYDTLERKVEDRTRELRDLTRRTELLLESIGDGVVAIDKDWTIFSWNAAATNITGWSREEAMGRPFREIVRFVRERDRSENVLFISDAMLSNTVRMMENHTVLIRKDGTEIPVGDSAAPIADAGGKVTGAIVVFRDATVERDAGLVRSSFAYASHQLRTPVTKALWAVEEALGAKRAAEAREKVRAAYASLLSVRKLVTALTEVSEVDQHMIIPKRERVSAAEVVDGALESLSGKAKARGVGIARGEVRPDAAIMTDGKLLTKVLYELLDNAIEYGKGSDVTIDVTTRGGDLVISVRDGGIGIVEGQQNLIFTKFFRGQNVPDESAGAGLGLYLCKAYMTLLGGKIWFRSVEGAGTTFFAALPLSADRGTSAS